MQHIEDQLQLCWKYSRCDEGGIVSANQIKPSTAMRLVFCATWAILSEKSLIFMNVTEDEVRRMYHAGRSRCAGYDVASRSWSCRDLVVPDLELARKFRDVRRKEISSTLNMVILEYIHVDFVCTQLKVSRLAAQLTFPHVYKLFIPASLG